MDCKELVLNSFKKYGIVCRIKGFKEYIVKMKKEFKIEGFKIEGFKIEEFKIEEFKIEGFIHGR